MRGLGTIHPHHEYHHSVKQPERPQALLAIVLPGVLRCHHRPIENHSTMGEIYTVLTQVHLTLGLVPGEHSGSVATKYHAVKQTDRAGPVLLDNPEPRSQDARELGAVLPKESGFRN